MVLDGDGVLLDYHAAYPLAWKNAFGVLPSLKDKYAYWPHDRWDVPRLVGAELEHFRSKFDFGFWSTIPANPGALEACKRLVDAGYKLVCVTALASQFQEARRQNLLSLGFPVGAVIATTNYIVDGVSPKAKAIRELEAVAFVDDYLPYLLGISGETHLALISRETNGTPNVGPELERVHSTHHDLAAFVDYWLQSKAKNPGNSRDVQLKC